MFVGPNLISSTFCGPDPIFLSLLFYFRGENVMISYKLSFDRNFLSRGRAEGEHVRGPSFQFRYNFREPMCERGIARGNPYSDRADCACAYDRPMRRKTVCEAARGDSIPLRDCFVRDIQFQCCSIDRRI